MHDTNADETRAQLAKWLPDDVSFKELTVGQFARLAAQTPGTFADALDTTPTEVEDPENLPDGEIDLGDDSSIIELQNGHVDVSDGSWWFKRASVARKDVAEGETDGDDTDDTTEDTGGEWRPYVGPEGGTGWTDGDEINYDDEFSPDPANIDDAATEEFLQRVPEDERQAAREELGIPSDGAQDGSKPDVPIEEGDPRVSLESAEQAAQTLQEWDADSYEFDYWEGAAPDDAVEGSVVEVASGDFQMLGDGQTAIVLDPEEQVAVTESGEQIEYSNSLGPGNLLGVFDDPANQVATGQREWDSFADEVVPDAVEDAQSDGSGTQTSEQDEQTPDFYDASPVGERLAESQFDSDITLTEDTTVAFGTDAREITDVATTDEKDTFRVTDSNDEFVVSDGVVGVESSGRLPKEGADSYIEFADEAPYDSGWYQAAEETAVTDDGGPSLTLVDEDGAVVEATDDVLDEMENTYTAIEDSRKVDSIQSLPEPTGSSDPAEWNVDWSETATDATADRPRLSDVQKEMFMREWRASVDDDAAVNSVEQSIRSNKNDPFTTGGQKYDKLIQSVMGVGGEPRENGFDDADEPTPDEVAAMETFTEASREMFRQQFGESHTAHRGLSDFAHDRLFDAIADKYAGEGESRDFAFEIEDNPASIWSTDDVAARTFAQLMNDTTMLKIDKEISPDEVFAMPESVLGFEEDEREYETSSDWDEGEVNIPGDGFDLTPADVTVPLEDGSDVTLADVLDVSETFQSLPGGAAEDAVAMINDFAPIEVREQFADQLAAADMPDDVVSRIERAVVQADPDTDLTRKDGPVIDVSDQVPPLYQVRTLNMEGQSDIDMARKSKTDVDALERELLNRYDGLESLHLNRRFTGRGADFHVQLLSVAEEQRGQGIGEAVVQAIVQAADRHDEIVTLNISPKDSTPASSLRRFYEQYGWQDASGRPDITADMYRPPRGEDSPIQERGRTSLFNMATDGEIRDTVPDGYEKRDGIYVRKDLDVPGYDALPVDDAPPETQRFIERFVAENDPRDESPLVYEILGSGVYDYKLEKSAVNYQTYPIEGENGEVEHCGNCKYAYHSNQSGNLICSQVTAPIGWRHWCNRWEYASPDDVLSEAYPSVDADAGTPIEEVREDG